MGSDPLSLARVRPTLQVRAAKREWDAVVIGAGPAGATAARLLAKRGAATLLVDRAEFPRPKVCGCCLNAAALGELEAGGAGDLTARLGAPPLRYVHLRSTGQQARIPIPTGAALSREVMDAELVRLAITAGAEFLPGAPAQVRDFDQQCRQVLLRSGRTEARLSARVVIVAHGLAGRSTTEPMLSRRPWRHARIGIAAICDTEAAAYEAGCIYLACADDAYVGVVRLEDERLNVAAAVSTEFVRAAGGPGQAAAAVLARAGAPPLAGLADLRWHGTPRLTTSPARIATPRLFLVGDAAGYVEPLTGEGMAWALACGRAVVAPAMQAIGEWRSELAAIWTATYRALIARRQVACRLIMHGVRHPRLTRRIVQLLAWTPEAARPVIRSFARPFAIR